MALASRSSMASTKMARPSMAMRTGRVARSAIRVSAKAGNWLPGSEQPSWLPEDLPGTFGFDPMGLSRTPEALARFQEAELIHCRWAMLGAAGVLAVELLGQGDWVSAQSKILDQGRTTYLGQTNPLDLQTLLFIEFVGFAVSETLRGRETDQSKKTYPGGPFDFANFSKGPGFEEYKLKEIKNGRLAMLANLGFIAQWSVTHKSPLAALGDHIADPWGANFATNGVSLPTSINFN